MSLVPIAVLLPTAVSVAPTTLDPPRAYSTVKTALLAAVAIAVVVASFALLEVRKARRARASWRAERSAVVG